MTKPGPSQPSPDHHHPAIGHAATRGDEKDAYSFHLVEGADYVLEDGKSVVLTQIGLERMVEALHELYLRLVKQSSPRSFNPP